jgi:hypothetical protein
MSNDIWGWLAFTMTAVSFLVSIKDLWAGPRRRARRIERFRSLKAWGVEWTAYDRDDEDQS